MKIPAASSASATPLTGATTVGTSPLEDARAKRQADKLQAAKQALASLKSSAKRPNAEAKARAREKLEALKKRLQQLRSMGATPRQIAALAKELKEAVKAYGGAGGSMAEAGVSAADTAPSSQAPADAALGDAAEDGAPPPAAAEKPADGAEGQKPVENPYDKAIAANAQSVAAAAAKSAEGEQDRDFLMKARQLVDSLKAAAAEAARKAKSGKPADAAEATKAAQEADKAVRDLQQSLGGGSLLALSA